MTKYLECGKINFGYVTLPVVFHLVFGFNLTEICEGSINIIWLYRFLLMGRVLRIKVIMQTQLIQKKAQIGSQVEFTLTTGNQVSGLLKEMSLEHVTLDAAKGEMTILVESIIAVQNLDNIDTVLSPSDTPDVDNQIKTSDPPSVKPDKTEVLDSASPPPAEVEISDNIETKSESTDSHPKGVKASDDTEIKSESIVTVPEELETPDDADPKTASNASVNFQEQASEKLVEIEKRFNKQFADVKLELDPPDLTFPGEELTGWQNTTVAGEWNRIKNKYENAEKINELSAKFDRIQPLVTDLKSLVKRFPNSPSLKRVFAYFYAISDNWQEAAQIYQEIAITSEDTNDWFNVAVSALNLSKEELACYSLEKFFNGVSVIDEPTAWYVYISLVEKFNTLFAFRELCRKDKNGVTDNEIAVLLDAAIYLLKKRVTTELAIEVIQKRMKGEPIEYLLKEVCQKLGGQSAESYRQFLTKFMNSMIASEKKTYPIPSKKQEQHIQVEDPYTSAKHADLVEKDLEKAERLFRKCVSQNIRHDSAIKDLAMVLVRLERPGEAVELLENKRPDIEDKQALDNTLIMVYPAAGQYEKAIDLLINCLKLTSEKEKRAHIRLQIASNYFKLEDYASAEQQFHYVLKLRPNNVTVQRNLALCLAKQQYYKDAEKVLRQIQRFSQDAKTVTLLEAVVRAQETGEFILDDDRIIEIETVLSYFSGELSDFAQFFLNRCTFDGVAPERVSEGKYTGSEKDFRHDIARLEDVAKRLGTRRPRDRGHYYLSAARIYFDLETNHNFFYRYLCRSFASRGDAAVSENKHLDTIREWYCEALTAYDGDKTRRGQDEQEAVNSLVRYLYSTLGPAKIDLTPNTPTINRVVRDVIDNHPDKKKVFDAIAHLVLHSRFAADRVLNRLYDNQTLRTMAVRYLKEMYIEVPDVMERPVDFVRPWNELRNKKSNADRDTSDKLRLLNNFDLTTSWLEDNIRFAEDIRSSLFFRIRSTASWRVTEDS